MTMSAARKKAYIFIESDICTRHFVFSGSLRQLNEQFDVTFIYPPQSWKRTKLDPASLPLGAPVREVAVPEKRVWLWKRLFQVHQLMFRPGKDYRERRRNIRGMFHWKQVVQITLYGLPIIYPFFKLSVKERLKKLPCTDLTALLENERPDVVLHPSTFDGYFINDLVAECKRLAIPSVLIMNSWDNPSIKQTVAALPDWCVVWGEQTADHCHRYLGISRDRIFKLGAAQFDVFRQPAALDRDEFCAEHNIDPGKTIVLYAGSSRGTDEFSHLEYLNAACADGRLPDAVILYRPHPWGACGKNGERMRDASWPNVRFEVSMQGYINQIAEGDRRPFIDADYRRAHDVLSNIDIVISPMSTMIIEGVLHGKPPLCFKPLDQEKGRSQFKAMADLIHFAEMFERDAFPVAHDQYELVEETGKLLDLYRNEDYINHLRQEIDFFVSPPEGSYGEALSNAVDTIVSSEVAADNPEHPAR
jgi:hypothetical protein